MVLRSSCLRLGAHSSVPALSQTSVNSPSPGALHPHRCLGVCSLPGCHPISAVSDKGRDKGAWAGWALSTHRMGLLAQGTPSASDSEALLGQSPGQAAPVRGRALDTSPPRTSPREARGRPT